MSDSRAKVLIVDGSRIVRATLVKHLRDAYDALEAVDGDAAWAALLADPGINVVIADLTMPRVDGVTLLECLRAAELPRLRQLPVLLLSGDQDESVRSRARAIGAMDFIAKGIGTTELLARVAMAVKLGAQTGAVTTDGDTIERDADGLFARAGIERQAASALSHATRHGSPLTLLVVGLDRMDEVRAQVGVAVATHVVQRFGQLLQGKIRREDSLGHYSPSSYAIVSPATPATGGMTFARRLREAVEAATMRFDGQRLPLTVSIGAASCPPETVTTPEGLLRLAAKRMQAAADAGGNRALGGEEHGSGNPPLPSLEHALRMIQAGRGNEISRHAPALALQTLPLLEWADRLCPLGLDVRAVATTLRERVQQTPDPLTEVQVTHPKRK